MFILLEFHTLQAKLPSVLPIHIRCASRWLTARNAHTSYAKIRHRQAYPGTFCERLEDGSILMGYGAKTPKEDDEFLHIRIGADGESVKIHRDVYCTLPLFYGYNGNDLIVSNDFREVFNRLSGVSLNSKSIAKTLSRLPPFTPMTLWNEIGILGERQVLRYTSGNLHVDMPSPRPWTFSSELAKEDARAFPGFLRSRFDHFIQTRFSNGKVGFELSGGLDSAFLPLFMAAKGLAVPAPAGTLVQPAHQEQQLRKIDDIERHTMLRSKRITLDPFRHYPLVQFMSAGRYQPFHMVHELYESGMVEIAEHLREQGVDVAVTGGGGDQLLEHRPHPSLLTPEKIQEYLTPAPPPFIIDAHQPPAEHLDPFAPIPTLLSPTIVHENIAHANIYIERDIWPVSPFYDVPLFNFCQALPVQFRANKNIFRAYFEASKFPISIYRGPNEDFGDFFETCLFSDVYQPILEHFVENSVLHQLGYVHAPKLYQTYLTMRQGGYDTQSLFTIYVWLVMEINLSLARGVRYRAHSVQAK